MATRGMTEFVSNGTAHTINDPNIANEFSASTAYSKGDFCYYQGTLYEFIADHAAGAWNSGHVQAVLLVNRMKSIVTNAAGGVSDINGYLFSGGDYHLTPDWINGAYNDSTGAFISLDTRVVSRQFSVYKGNRVWADLPSGFTFKVCKWTHSGTFIDNGQWFGSGAAWIATADMTISIMATDDSTVDPSTFSGTITVDTWDKINTMRMNSRNLIDAYIEANTVVNGITIEYWQGLLKLGGTATQTTYWDLLSSLNTLPYGIGKNQDYYLSFDSPLEQVYITIYFNQGSGWVKKYDNLRGLNKISVPDNAIGMLVRLYVTSGTIIPRNSQIYLTLGENPSNRDLMKEIDNSGGGGNENSMQVRFLEQRGTGDCTVIKFEDGTTLMVDFGYWDAGQGVLEARFQEVLSELRITHIDYAIISHFHSDHCGLLMEGVMDSLMNGQTTVYMPAPFTSAQLAGIQAYDEAAHDGVYDTYTATTTKLNVLGCTKVYPQEGQQVNIGGAIVRFWNTDHTAYLNRIIAGTLLDYNYCSLCNFLTLGTVRIAFTGDASPEVLDDCKAQLYPSQILKVNHHCAGYAAAGNDVMNRLMPQIAVTLCGDTMVESTVKISGQQAWFEANNVPNILTGLNQKTLSMLVTTGGYVWNTPCRKYIVADEE